MVLKAPNGLAPAFSFTSCYSSLVTLYSVFPSFNSLKVRLSTLLFLFFLITSYFLYEAFLNLPGNIKSVAYEFITSSNS